MTVIINDYDIADEIEGGLFVVQLSDGGWSIADDPGTKLSPPDEVELAGHHLPVKFAVTGAGLEW